MQRCGSFTAVSFGGRNPAPITIRSICLGSTGHAAPINVNRAKQQSQDIHTRLIFRADKTYKTRATILNEGRVLGLTVDEQVRLHVYMGFLNSVA